MEIVRLSIVALCCLVFVGADVSPTYSNFWETIWPNTPLPKAFYDLLAPHGNTNDLPISPREIKQYSTLFFEHDLYPGKTITLGRGRLSGRERQGITDSIWLANKERQSLDDFCASPTAKGEQKHCVSSLESMLEHVISHFGTTKIKAIASTFSTNQDQYAVEEVKRVGDNAVMCHRLNFEKVVFNCHQVKATTAYVVSLVAPDGTKAKALTVCHHDTRGMNAALLNEVLNVKPGTVPVCHFIGNKAAAWVPNDSDGNVCAM